MKLLEPTLINNIALKNRVVMEPMCMYSAHDNNGIPTYFHQAHYGSRAIGQVGTIIVEATGVVPEGRITDDCLGLWNREQMEAFKPIVDTVHTEGSTIFIQLNHAGRKSTCVVGVDTIYGPSPLAFNDEYRVPVALSENGISDVVAAFKNSALLAMEAGFDGIELHGAHGYLISEFMSPISNIRDDAYHDGSQLIREIATAVREVMPSDKILGIRVSATDYEDNGLNTEKTIQILKDSTISFDYINVSTGGITPTPPHAIYPGYQVPHAMEIKGAFPQTPVMACGLLGDIGLASYLLETDCVDFIGLARPLLDDPHWVLHAAQARRKHQLITKQYTRAFK
ncbi:NADPH dehydrogenase [Erysipelothrix sp. HDW6C]|uniref:oxidoreductase n=1 Tax=Erysipelothrix sp. HDW6C TaxID=2714930 RepID=UPI001408C60D|nr:NADPH dehydrogenase [Erysipelothrix sp. HDW6C]QIK70220.1 NADPH dehydrogenase [Erysipelothrix sp. HDW6C]